MLFFIIVYSSNKCLNEVYLINWFNLSTWIKWTACGLFIYGKHTFL